MRDVRARSASTSIGFRLPARGVSCTTGLPPRVVRNLFPRLDPVYQLAEMGLGVGQNYISHDALLTGFKRAYNLEGKAAKSPHAALIRVTASSNRLDCSGPS